MRRYTIGAASGRRWHTMKGMMKKRGFSLLEVIVSVVITAILGSLLLTMMRNPLTASSNPVLSLKNAYNLQKVMENMASFTNGLPSLTSSIGAEGSSQSNTSYGVYQVVYNRYIQFSGSTNAETSGGTNILKVTIKDTSGDRLTRIFCQ